MKEKTVDSDAIMNVEEFILDARSAMKFLDVSKIEEKDRDYAGTLWLNLHSMLSEAEKLKGKLADRFGFE